MAVEARCKRAIALTAPKALARTAGLTAEGHWLDTHRYFFIAEHYDASLDRVVGVPSIANCKDLCITPVPPQEQGRTLQALSVPALYAPNGLWACVVRDQDLWLCDLQNSTERPLTTDGAPHYCYGQESESNLSALSYRASPEPMALWSSDSRWLLTHRIDERTVPDLPLVEHVPADAGRPKLHRYKYPFPCDPMPMAVFVAIDVATGRKISFDDFPVPVLGYSPFSAFYRTAWFGTHDLAWILRLDRYSKRGELIRLDLTHGIARIVIAETVDSGYLEFHQSMVGGLNVRSLDQSAEVIWFSERDGWGHLYLYDIATGQLKNRITSGAWLVRDIVHIDVDRRTLHFTASGMQPEVDPARRSLCSVNLDGTDLKVLITHDGDIAVPVTPSTGPRQDRPFAQGTGHPGVSPDGQHAVVHYCSVERGDRVSIINLSTGRTLELASVPAPPTRSPRIFSTAAADAQSRTHGVMVLPSDFDSRQVYPLIDYIYPGPHIPHQPQRFSSVRIAFARALAELGFVVIMLDTRGVPFRSRAQHQIGYGHTLEPQLSDHAAAVQELCTRHTFIDRNRVGIIGHSAGGAAAARALFDYGAIFKVGVSVCGSHDSSLVTTMWSDKYRGPGNPESWKEQANAAAAHQLTGKLLLIHGDLDENVHISQTFKLVDALIRANRDFDFLAVPTEGHDLLMTNGYVQRRAWEYLVRHLRNESPPADLEIRFEPHELARLEHCYWLDFWP